ncbi:MAG TPA: hypothetical protein VGF25_20465 [Thermoleophilaceae bacterium]|jgi:hypothetical protein
MRFRDFLRVSVLLFGGAATALAVVSVLSAARDDDDTVVIVAAVWWTCAAAGGLWFGRRLVAQPYIAHLLASARRANALPELEPGAVIFNRMWPLAILAIASGAVGFFFPQVPMIATGYALGAALLWRRQSSAVAAIEGRDGVEFWLDRSSPFGPPKLLRLPGLRKIDPTPA